MYVAFDATQTRTPIVMNQRTNNVGVDTDDEVKISLWPGGRNGVNYQFIATPAAVKYQYSTENSNYEPSWDAIAATKTNGYIVVMRIPLKIMRGAQATWLMNMTRYEPTVRSAHGAAARISRQPMETTAPLPTGEGRGDTSEATLRRL